MKTETVLRISFNESGSGSISTSARLPITWIREMGIDTENREVKARFEDGKIIIEKLNKLLTT